MLWFTTRSQPDQERSLHLLKMAENRHEFGSQKIDDKFTSLKAEAFYDIIKELIFSHMYKMVFKCSNHLCLIAYLQENFKNFDYEINKIDELRQLHLTINLFALKVDSFQQRQSLSETNSPKAKIFI